jgi:hypothetical protein
LNHESKSLTDEKRVINACIDLAMGTIDEGSLFAIDLSGKNRTDFYTTQYSGIANSKGRPFSVFKPEERMVIKQLAELDGAVIINKQGEMIEFGATLKRHKDFLAHGKRHAFALGTSEIKDMVCVLASEEDHHIRTFKEGVCVADIDGRTKLPVTVKQKVVDLLTTPMSATLISAGIATSVLTLNPIPAIITIAGSNVIVSGGFERLKAIFQGNPPKSKVKKKKKGRKRSKIKAILSILFVLH